MTDGCTYWQTMLVATEKIESQSQKLTNICLNFWPVLDHKELYAPKYKYKLYIKIMCSVVVTNASLCLYE